MIIKQRNDSIFFDIWEDESNTDEEVQIPDFFKKQSDEALPVGGGELIEEPDNGC